VAFCRKSSPGDMFVILSPVYGENIAAILKAENKKKI
jgi:hypothetical protein